MRFEVIDSRDGRVKMSTQHRSCIYPANVLKQLEAAGYKFKLNGKRWKPGQEISNETPKEVPCKVRDRGDYRKG